MTLSLFEIWYVIIGFLLGNGVPHFVFGRAGKLFRSPFGQRSPPRTNVGWGLANFTIAVIIGGLLAMWGLIDAASVVFVLIGFLLAMVFFGARIKEFLNE